MRLLSGMLIFLIVSATVAAGAGEYVLPKSLRLALPKDGSVKTEWIAPPLAEAAVRKAGFSELRFRLDNEGRAWVAYDRKYISDFSSGWSFSLGRPVHDFLFLANGAMVVVTDTSLGTVAPFGKDRLSGDALPELPFQPICRLPLEKCGLAAGAPDRIFVYGFDAAAREHAVYGLDKDFSTWRKVFVAGEKISAVIAAADALYVAAGRMVYKVPRKAQEPAKIVFSHPLEVIGSLTYLEGTGIFYATASGLGVITAAGALEFMKSRQSQVAVRAGALCVFLPDSLGILRFAHTEHLLTTAGK